MNIHQIANFTFQIFHGIAWLFSTDLPDHGEDCFHVVRCVRRYLEVVVPCRFRVLLTPPGQLKNWLRVQGVSPKLYCFGQQVLLLQYQVPAAGLSESSEFPSSWCDGSPRCSSINVCILESHLKRRRCVE